MDQASTNIDEKLFLALNRNHSEFFDYIMLFASNLFSSIPVFILIAIIAARYYKKQGEYFPIANSILLISVLLLSFLFCFLVLPQTFSFLFERTRPCVNPNISTWVRLVGEDCSSGNNFFAVRPCIMFCITSFLFFTIKTEFLLAKIALVIWSLLVSYSRIYLGAHYPANILVADLTGIFFGYITSKFYFYMKYDVIPFLF